MGCLVVALVITVLAILSVVWLAARTLQRGADRVDEYVRSAHRQLFELTRHAYVAMLDEARRQQRGRS